MSQRFIFTEKRDMANLLALHCIVHPTRKGFAQYEEGWDDSRVAEVASAALGRSVTNAVIGRLRCETIGQLNTSRKVSAREAVTTELEERLAGAEGRIADLVARVAYLERELGVVHVDPERAYHQALQAEAWPPKGYAKPPFLDPRREGR